MRLILLVLHRVIVDLYIMNISLATPKHIHVDLPLSCGVFLSTQSLQKELNLPDTKYT